MLRKIKQKSHIAISVKYTLMARLHSNDVKKKTFNSEFIQFCLSLGAKPSNLATELA